MNQKNSTTLLRQLATLIAAGVPILDALQTLASTNTHPATQSMLTTIQHELQNGSYLSQALRLFPKHFNSLTIQLIRLGEHTGTLDTTLLTIAQHHEQQHATKRQIKQALFYPAIITVTAILMLITMFLFVIPLFAELFRDQPLPLLTRIIFSLSRILHHAILPIAFFTTLAIFCIRHYHLSLPIPFSKTYQHKIILARFARQLALCLTSGLPIVDALRLTIQPQHHPDFTRLIYQIRNQLNTGQTLHTAMQQHDYFPPLMLQMIKTGDATGKMDCMLEKIAELYEADTTHFLKQLGQLLEPLIMIILGVLIGGLVIGMYLPVFKLGNTL